MSFRPEFSHTVIKANGVRSLVWAGDSLVDWAAGGKIYHLDGSCQSAKISFGDQFDAAVSTPSGEYAVIYTKLGTKGLLLRNGRLLRELNRSYYHADVYEYPICLVNRGERTFLVHCPDEYNKLEIEDALTGERLTSRSSPTSDFFHSRLSASPDGKYLLSAGWVWQPWDAVVFYDLDLALRDPQHLDSLDMSQPRSRNVCFAEEASACWQTCANVIMTGGMEEEDPEEAVEANALRLRPKGIAVYDVQSRTLSAANVLSTPAGLVMPVGLNHAIAFYRHPRLLRLSDGFVEFTIPTISSGEQLSSIIHHLPPLPPLALDRENSRFAIAQPDGIHIVSVRVAP